MANEENWKDKMHQIERTLQLSELELKYVVHHYFDDRPKGIGEAKITFDAETRKAIAGYKAVIEELNSMRLEVGVEPI